MRHNYAASCCWVGETNLAINSFVNRRSIYGARYLDHRRLPEMPLGVGLIRMADPEDHRLVERLADDLKAERKRGRVFCCLRSGVILDIAIELIRDAPGLQPIHELGVMHEDPALEQIPEEQKQQPILLRLSHDDRGLALALDLVAGNIFSIASVLGDSKFNFLQERNEKADSPGQESRPRRSCSSQTTRVVRKPPPSIPAIFASTLPASRH